MGRGFPEHDKSHRRQAPYFTGFVTQASSGLNRPSEQKFRCFTDIQEGNFNPGRPGSSPENDFLRCDLGSGALDKEDIQKAVKMSREELLAFMKEKTGIGK